MDHFRWSPRSIKEYGPGIPSFANVGDWNLYWASYPNLEQHAHDGDLVAPFADLVRTTANQLAGVSPVGTLAGLLPAAQFLELIEKRDIDHLALVQWVGRDIWLGMLRARIEELESATRADCHFDLTPQQNGTGTKKSTNMLPLVGLGSRILH